MSTIRNIKHREVNEAELMYIVCAYCRNFIDVRQGSMYSISHGICPDCFKVEMEKAKNLMKKDKEHEKT